MKKNILAAVMSIALAASMLAGCGSSNTTSTSAAETKAEESTEADTTADDKSAKDLKEVNVVLDWYPNALHTFIYTAIEKGYYEEEGLKVNIQFPSNANDALSLVAAGKAEIGLYYQHDIIQAVTFHVPEGVIEFCKGIQAAAPVDSYVDPEPWDMPGYDSQVIMAAGAFVQGSSIELSADGPMKPPYAVYFQGGLTWEHAKLGVLMSLQKMVDKGLVTLK